MPATASRPAVTERSLRSVVCLSGRQKRRRAFIFFALATGMRRGELVALEWQDINFESGVIIVRNEPFHATKSRKVRRLTLGPAAAELLRELEKDTSGSMVFQTPIGTDGEQSIPGVRPYRE